MMADVIATFTKDPNAVLDYSIDWGTNYLESSDTISTSAWTVPTGITKDSDTKSGTKTTIWLSGGSAGESYELVNRIVTNDGRTDDRSIRINVREQ